jgi:KUP system potassium uptake protein
MTHQAIQLGYLPRMEVRHTSASTMGQIYVPAVNAVLLVAVAAAVAGFGTSSSLASAYGISVMGTMIVTTILTFFVVRYGWGHSLALSLAVTAFFFLVDAAFLGAALHKVLEGGWFPLALGAVVFASMMTWRQGRERLLRRLQAETLPLKEFLQSLSGGSTPRVPGTAVFLTADPGSVPRALLHSLKHYRVLHERNVFLNVQFTDEPAVPPEAGVTCREIAPSCWQVGVRYGFMDRPEVPLAIERCGRFGLVVDPMDVSYFLSRERLVPTAARGMARARQLLFTAMARNAGSVADYFEIPPNRVVELGASVHL